MTTTIADTHRQHALAALRTAAEHADAGRLDHALAFRGYAIDGIRRIADARGWTYGGMRDRLEALAARAEVRT